MLYFKKVKKSDKKRDIFELLLILLLLKVNKCLLKGLYLVKILYIKSASCQKC